MATKTKTTTQERLDAQGELARFAEMKSDLARRCLRGDDPYLGAYVRSRATEEWVTQTQKTAGYTPRNFHGIAPQEEVETLVPSAGAEALGEATREAFRRHGPGRVW